MADGYQSLTDKEKETLRLILQGHDAKSMACELDLSVHTVNERLRGARRKLEVTSSKQAARLLLEEEGDAPQFLGHKPLGEATAAADGPQADSQQARIPRTWMIGGSLAMSVLIAVVAFATLAPPTAPQSANLQPAEASQTTTAPIDSAVVRAAREWLELVDAGDWSASWEATGAPFHELNTAETWARASDEARGLLGGVLSREVVSEQWVPAPPKGYQMVKFRTQFAKRPDSTETLTLVREDGVWKVVGCWIT